MPRARPVASLKAALATVVVVGAVAPATSHADLRVGSAPGFGILLQSDGENGWRAIVEHFADGSRNGARVRQIGFGDPRIFSGGDDICFGNAFANDVVCNDATPFVQSAGRHGQRHDQR
jgi:hypothetical protein